MKFGELAVGDKFRFVTPSGEHSSIRQKVENQATEFNNSGVFRMCEPNESRWNYVAHNDAEVVKLD